MRPDLGPLRLLCVVVVTTSAYRKGLFALFVATRPAICDISQRRYAPTSLAIS